MTCYIHSGYSLCEKDLDMFRVQFVGKGFGYVQGTVCWKRIWVCSGYSLLEKDLGMFRVQFV